MMHNATKLLRNLIILVEILIQRAQEATTQDLSHTESQDTEKARTYSVKNR